MFLPVSFPGKVSKGFSLIELLIVVVLISILIAVGAASYSDAQKKARNGQRQSDLQKIALALEEYYADWRQYPNAATGAFDPINAVGVCLAGGGGCGTASTKTYLTSIPKDPQTGNNYVYAPTNDNSQFAGTQYQSFTLSATGEGSPVTDVKSPTH